MASIRLPAETLRTVGARFGFDSEALEYMYSRGAHDFYRFSCHCRNQIIRISKLNSGLDEVRAEIHFVQYLRDAGACVPQIAPSLNGKSIEYFTLNDLQYVAVAFERYEDTQASPQLTNGTIRALGRSVGVIHRISREYSPPVETWKRNTCRENILASPDLMASVKSVLGAFDNFSRNSDTYGLVHGNLVRENISVTPDGLIIHGFESCCRCFFAYDIAVALHDCMKKNVDTCKREYTEYFLEMFFKGYDEENNIDNMQLDSIPLFLKLLDLINP